MKEGYGMQTLGFVERRGVAAWEGQWTLQKGLSGLGSGLQLVSSQAVYAHGHVAERIQDYSQTQQGRFIVQLLYEHMVRDTI